MLVLTRKVGEQITIADNILVTVVKVTGDHVRLGITAPGEIPVHRQEVLQRIQQGGGKRESARAAMQRAPAAEATVPTSASLSLDVEKSEFPTPAAMA